MNHMYVQYENLQTKVSTFVHGLPHFGQQKLLSFPVPFDELDDRFWPEPLESVGADGPALHSQKLVVINLC